MEPQNMSHPSPWNSDGKSMPSPRQPRDFPRHPQDKIPHASTGAGRQWGAVNRSGKIRRHPLLMLGMITATTLGALVWTWKQPAEYEGKFQLLVEPVASYKSSVELPSLSPSGVPDALNLELERSTGMNFGQFSPAPQPRISLETVAPTLDYDSQIEVLESPEFMTPIIEELKSQYPDLNYSSLLNQKATNRPLTQNRLSVNRVGKTKILEVRYRDFEPEKIETVLQKIAERYLNYGRDNSQTEILDKSLNFITTQSENLRSKINSLQNEIQTVQQDYQFIDPTTQTQLLTQQTSQLQLQILENQSQLGQQKSLYQMLQSQLGLTQQEALIASMLNQSPQYQTLLQQLQELEAKIAIEASRFKETAPQLQVLHDQHRNILGLLQETSQQILGQDLNEVNPNVLKFQDSLRLDLTQQLITTANQIQVLGVRQQVLENASRQLDEYVKGFPEGVRRYTELQRELQIATYQLNNLFKQQEALEFKQAVGEGPVTWELIALPQLRRNADGELVRVFSDLPRNLALGGVAGLILGMLAAQLAESMNKVFRTPQQMKETAALPLLGVIPASPAALLPSASAEPGLASWDSLPLDAFAESFRLLNANLRFLNLEEPIRSCVISSALPADGKSTVAAHLAQAAAAMGQQVLLVDADLRRPNLHQQFGLSNKLGLSSVLSENTDLAVAIQQPQYLHKPSIQDKLFVLPAGRVPCDPTHLLASKKMQVLMKKLSAMYDLVIYDTPPMLGLADANLLLPYTNGLMLVVGLQKTERSALMLTLDGLRTLGVPVLGMVANGDRRNSQYQRQYHHYYSLEPNYEILKLGE